MTYAPSHRFGATFRLFALFPYFDDRDGVQGHRAVLQTSGYRTAEAALRDRARLMAADEIMGTDDMSFYVVVPEGASPFDTKAVVHPDYPVSDDIPF